MTQRIAFDYQRLQVRQIVIDSSGRKHVCSAHAKHLARFTWDEIWRTWARRGYVLVSRTEHVIILKYMGAKAEAKAA